MKTLVQCDFDGTITQKDIGFLLLDAYGNGDWKRLLTDYREGRISVGCFNTEAFTMINADRQTLLEFVKDKMKVRAGFHELLAYCRKKDFKFVIVSNGLDFYIEEILKNIGIEDINVFAARTQFTSKGIEVKYIGPDGSQLDNDFKEAYIRLFLRRGYRVIYVGNGLSDILPARQAHYIFATGELLDYCKRTSLNYTSFVDLNDVVRGLELLQQE